MRVSPRPELLRDDARGPVGAALAKAAKASTIKKMVEKKNIFDDLQIARSVK